MQGHFLVGYLSFIVYRLMHERVEDALTEDQMLSSLQSMTMANYPGEGYVPAYTRTSITNYLNGVFGLSTDREIITTRHLREMLKKPPDRPKSPTC